MKAWVKKGYAAGKSGRFRDMYAAFSAAKGKPPKKDDGSGRMVESAALESARHAFYSGYQTGERDASAKVGGRFNPGGGRAMATKKKKRPAKKAAKRNGGAKKKRTAKRPAARNGSKKKKRAATSARNPLSGYPIGKWFSTVVNGVKTKVRRTAAGFEVAAKKK